MSGLSGALRAILWVVALVVALGTGASVAGAASEQTGTSTGSGVAATEQHLDQDVRVAEADLTSLVSELRRQLRAAVGSGAVFPSDIVDALARDRNADGGGWIAEALVSAIIAIVAGLIPAILLERMTIRGLPRAPAEVPADRAAAERRLWVTLLYLAGAVVMLAVGFAAVEIMDSGIVLRYQTALTIVSAFAATRFVVLALGAVLTPADPRDALRALTPAEAARLRRRLVAFTIVFAVLQTLDAWFAMLGLSPGSEDFAALLVSLLLAGMLCWLAITERRTLPKALGLVPPTSTLERFVAAAWWIIAILYFVVAWFARAISTLVDAQGSSGLVVAPVLLFAAGIVIYGALHVAIGRTCRPQVTLWIGGLNGRRIPDFCDLAFEAAALFVALAGLVVLAVVWGAGLDSSGVAPIMIKISVIAIVGYIAYQWVRIAIDRKHAREGGIPGIVSDDARFVPLAPGKSRLATLLPLARVFVLGAIIVVVVLMILSELGVNVVPLFAGASIFGLAIGFGSQTLVHDVMSGAFFLVDDAFRVGEYVDLGGGSKGTVEKISIRSFQLRHQNGPLHTIPFGGIKQVTNLSRDWAITKLPFSFPHGTDVEKVRKVIKKVGEALSQDAVLGPMFLDPVKSQGVTEMDSNSMTFTVKFMTRPADGSAVKRAVYARLSQAFIAAGLDFASSTVVVKIAGEPDKPLTDAERQAMAGAAASMATGG